ncbi:MAG: methionine gamma-lyase family protein [Clostridia bacterium]|nr:methionine gamma-lyase family protein [Clostridia bacterium]
MYYGYGFSDEVVRLAEQAERDCAARFAETDEICLRRSADILRAFQENRVSTADFLEVTGYGYTDPGREKLERIYAQIFGAEDALVRVQIMSGTHALTLALGGILKYGDTLLAVSGDPYDTLQGVIGITGGSRNSLIANGIRYEKIDLVGDDFDHEAIRRRLTEGKKVRCVHIQRSRGYARRKSLTLGKIGRVIRTVREADPEAIVFVDNCYGEFVENAEPTHLGADLIVGSMMKNPGGGIAVTGGYCAGRRDLIGDVAERLTCPCVGRDLGANLNQLTSLYKGLFLAPSVTRSAVRSMIFASRLLELAGFTGLSPRYDEERTDIVQTVDLLTAENLVAFCRGLQRGSPIEAYAVPEPCEMPGYEDKEVMAGGSFTSGSTIELSCDGPVKPPYTAFMQGGLSYEYGKLGVMNAVDFMLRQKKA